MIKSQNLLTEANEPDKDYIETDQNKCLKKDILSQKGIKNHQHLEAKFKNLNLRTGGLYISTKNVTKSKNGIFKILIFR